MNEKILSDESSLESDNNLDKVSIENITKLEKTKEQKGKELQTYKEQLQEYSTHIIEVIVPSILLAIIFGGCASLDYLVFSSLVVALPSALPFIYVSAAILAGGVFYVVYETVKDIKEHINSKKQAEKQEKILTGEIKALEKQIKKERRIGRELINLKHQLGQGKEFKHVRRKNKISINKNAFLQLSNNYDEEDYNYNHKIKGFLNSYIMSKNNSSLYAGDFYNKSIQSNDLDYSENSQISQVDLELQQYFRGLDNQGKIEDMDEKGIALVKVR